MSAILAELRELHDKALDARHERLLADAEALAAAWTSAARYQRPKELARRREQIPDAWIFTLACVDATGRASSGFIEIPATEQNAERPAPFCPLLDCSMLNGATVKLTPRSSDTGNEGGLHGHRPRGGDRARDR